MIARDAVARIQKPRRRPVAMKVALSQRASFTEEDEELIAEQWYRAARASFWAYRQLMHPTMKRSWFQRQLARRLQRFYDDLVAGKKPKLIIMAPPQHGKSETITDFIAWISGKHPELKTIFASFSLRLGIRTNLRIQRQLDSEKYQRVFPNGARLAQGMGSGYLRNQDILEFTNPDGEGSFRNTTVNGPVNGESLDLGVIDDPLKGRAEANSPTNRDKVWEWLTDDFFTRFSEDGALLMILTRWHLDDPAGRLIIEDPSVEVVKYQAIADEDEYDPESGLLLRRKGEALFPEHKSLAFLKARKKLMSLPSWVSIYQQSPVVLGGELFPVELFQVVYSIPKGCRVVKAVRYWDKAGTQGGGKYSAGVLMAKLDDGRFIILDVFRKQLGYHDREQMIKQTAKDDGKDVYVWVEQEPGSGGKESAERTIANLPGYTVAADKVQGDKYTRAEPYAGQVQGSNMLLIGGPWVKAFKEEHEYFPNGPYKDQVDAAAGAFAKLSDDSGKTVKMLF